jgi:hypothetical protein
MHRLFTLALAVFALFDSARARACDRPLTSPFDQIAGAPIAVIADVENPRWSARRPRLLPHGWNARVVRTLSGTPRSEIALGTGSGSDCRLAFDEPGRYLLFLERTGEGFFGSESAFRNPSDALVGALLRFRAASNEAERSVAIVDALESADASVARAATHHLHVHPAALAGTGPVLRTRVLGVLARASEVDAMLLSVAAASFGHSALPVLAGLLERHSAIGSEPIVRVLECATNHSEPPGSRRSLARRWRSYLAARGSRLPPVPAAEELRRCTESASSIPADVFSASEYSEWIVVGSMAGTNVLVERTLAGGAPSSFPLSTEMYTGPALPASGRVILIANAPVFDDAPIGPDNPAYVREWRPADHALAGAMREWAAAPVSDRRALLLRLLGSRSEAVVREVSRHLAAVPGELEGATAGERRSFMDAARRCSDPCLENLLDAFVELRMTEAVPLLEERARRAPEYADSYRSAAAALR